MIKDLTTKIYLQQAAVKALPVQFQEAAMVVDDTAPPKDRPFPYWDTPPIKDFDFRRYMGDDRSGKSDEEDDEDEDVKK